MRLKASRRVSEIERNNGAFGNDCTVNGAVKIRCKTKHVKG